MPSWAINNTKLSNYIKLNKMVEISKNNEIAQLGIGDVMPSSCLFQGQRRAIIKETKHFYFFACGTIFQWDYAEKQLCSDVR